MRDVVDYCIQMGWAWVQPVLCLAWPMPRPGQLFGKPQVMFPWAEDVALQSKLLARSRFRLLLKPEGRKTLAADRVGAGAPAGEEGTEVEPPTSPLSQNEEKVILYLLEQDDCLRLQQDIAVATDLERKTVGSCLSTLRARGLVHRPGGERKGEALTDLGKQVANQAANHPGPAGG